MGMNSGTNGPWLQSSALRTTAEVRRSDSSRVLLVTVFIEFDNYGACMRYLNPSLLISVMTTKLAISVSEDLLCAFELLKPLDGTALRKEMTKVKRKRYEE